MPARALDEQRVREVIAAVYERSPRERPLDWAAVERGLPLYADDPSEPSLGLDSLDAVEIATELEEAFDLVLPDEIDPADLRTFADVMAMLGRLAAEQHGTGD